MSGKKRGPIVKGGAFYRTYDPADVRDLDEAIRLATEGAEAMGLREIEVNRQQTGTLLNGRYQVGLRGRMQAAIDREARGGVKRPTEE